MKKVLIVLLIIIIVAFGVLIARELILNSNEKVDKSNPMSREEVITLLEKGKEYNNYYYCSNIDAEEMKTEYYIKDNIIVMMLDSELKLWTDLNNKEEINIWNMGKEKLVATINTYEEINKDSQAGFDYSLVTNEDDYDFEYIGEVEREGRKTILINMKYKNGNGDNKFYIDKETGLIVGRKSTAKVLFVTTFIDDANRNVKLDVVTDEDIKRPDLTQYEALEHNQ